MGGGAPSDQRAPPVFVRTIAHVGAVLERRRLQAVLRLGKLAAPDTSQGAKNTVEIPSRPATFAVHDEHC